MYLIYLFKEKSNNTVFYVGSSARPSARMKEHLLCLNGSKQNNQKVYSYMKERNLQFYKDVEVIWVDCAESRQEMYNLEAQYYYKYKETLTNDRPAENRNGQFNPKRRKVRCKSENKTFNSLIECAKHYNIPRTTLTGWLNKPHSKHWTCDFEYIS